MRKVARKLRSGLFTGIALLVLVPGSSAMCYYTYTYPYPAAGQIPDINGGDDYGYRLYLKGDGTVTPDEKASGPASYSASDATGGIRDSTSWVSQGGGTTLSFTMKEPFEKERWVNLSKPAVVGILWYSSSSWQSAKSDSIAYRVDFFFGERYGGGASCSMSYFGAYGGGHGGSYGSYPPDNTGWASDMIVIRPEFASLVQGEKLTVKVTRQGSLSDFQVGTAAPHQSFFEFRVTDYDLVKTAVKLQAGTLTFAGPGSGGTNQTRSEEPRSGESSKPPATGLAAPLLLLPLVSARRRRAGAMAALLLLGAFAGCLGTESAGPVKEPGSTAKATVSTRQVEHEGLEAAGHGAIEGVVRNDINLPLDKAHVALLQTNLFTQTDPKGRFYFPNVSAGQYTIRIDRVGYQPLEKSIAIVVGKILTLDVTLVPSDDKGANLREHVHDNWQGELQKQLWQLDFRLGSYLNPTVNGQGLMQSTGKSACAYFTGCLTSIPTPYDKPVPPGTGVVEVTFKFDAAPQKMLGLYFYSPKYYYYAQQGAGTYQYLYKQITLPPRPSGVPFKIYIFPDEADPGHQGFTGWSFYAFQPSTWNTYAVQGQPAAAGDGAVQMTTVAHKGTVVAEPAHKIVWGNKTELPLYTDKAKTSNCLPYFDFPYSCVYWYYYDMNAPKVVPAGTAELRGTLKWDGPATTLTTWGLKYYPGGQKYFGHAKADYDNLKTAEGTRSGNTFTFKIAVDPKSVDSFYETYSKWMFFLDDGRDSVYYPYGVNTAYQGTFTLSVTAVKDPAYVEE